MSGGTYMDLRGTPKGRAQVWEISRLILPRFRKRRIRETLVIAWCEEGWHGDSGTADRPSEPICHSLPLMRISGEPTPKWWGDLDGFHKFHADRPCVWKIQSSSKDGLWTHFYCIAEVPVEYRDLVHHRPEDRTIEPGPRFTAWRTPTHKQKEAS
jgi:hypothetical protein